MTQSAPSESMPPDAAPAPDPPASALERLTAAYAQTEAALSAASEKLVSSEAFADFLAFTTGNVLSVVRIANDTADSLVRNLRLAGRRDVARLGTQLARTEDKLERLLQEVRELRTAVRDGLPTPDGDPPGRPDGDQPVRTARTRTTTTKAAPKQAGRRADR